MRFYNSLFVPETLLGCRFEYHMYTCVYGIETNEFDDQDMEQTSDDDFAVGANPLGAGMT